LLWSPSIAQDFLNGGAAGLFLNRLVHCLAKSLSVDSDVLADRKGGKVSQKSERSWEWGQACKPAFIILSQITMARWLRIESPGEFYHVIIRGNQREDIFLDDEEKKIHRAAQPLSGRLGAMDRIGSSVRRFGA
jgi:hypothetical protein